MQSLAVEYIGVVKGCEWIGVGKGYEKDKVRMEGRVGSRVGIRGGMRSLH